MKALMDTWGWVTLYNKREKRHEEIKNWYYDFHTQKGLLYTTDYILDETFTLLFLRTPIEIALKTLEIIDESIRGNYLTLERITPIRFERTKELRKKYKDKPQISFTDLTTLVVMLEKDIEAIITEDIHFSYLESGFQRFPISEREQT